MGAVISYGDLLAANLARLRRDRGHSQQELARRARAAGMDWDRMTVAGIENGRRALTVGEWLVIPIVLGCSPLELVSFEEDYITHVELDGALLTPEQLALVVDLPAGRTLPSPEALASYDEAPVDDSLDAFASRETNRKVAKRMGWSVRHLVTRSKHLWEGRDLAAERERRLGQTAPSGTSPRVLQALRGHITRELIYELQHPRAPRAVLTLPGRQRDVLPSTKKPSKPAAPSSAR